MQTTTATAISSAQIASLIGLGVLIALIALVVWLHKNNGPLKAWMKLVSFATMLLLLTVIIWPYFGWIWGNTTRGALIFWNSGAMTQFRGLVEGVGQSLGTQSDIPDDSGNPGSNPGGPADPGSSSVPVPAPAQGSCRFSNQSVINAYKTAFGDGYWSRVQSDGLTGMANNRQGCFDQPDKMAPEVARVLGITTDQPATPPPATPPPADGADPGVTPVPTPTPSPAASVADVPVATSAEEYQFQLDSLQTFLQSSGEGLIQDSAAVWNLLPPCQWTVQSVQDGWRGKAKENWTIACATPGHPLQGEVVNRIAGSVLHAWGLRRIGAVINR